MKDNHNLLTPASSELGTAQLQLVNPKYSMQLQMFILQNFSETPYSLIILTCQLGKCKIHENRTYQLER